MTVMPTWDQITKGLAVLSVERELYGGIPTPVEGLRLVLEKKREDAAGWARFRFPSEVTEDEGTGLGEHETVRNHWENQSTKTQVWIVWKHQPGHPDFKAEVVKERWGWYREALTRQKMMIDTGLAATAYLIEAEERALVKLADLVTTHQFKMYLLTGMVAEMSKRSQVCYWFRRMRPTIAMKVPCDSENLHFLAALCMHPIGYYADTWAGVMAPTDEMIAHLLLMRGDEKMFWRRANQHPITALQAGL